VDDVGMAQVYSELLIWEKALAGDSAAYAVPTGQLWVVRDISVYNGNSAVIVDASLTTYDGVVLWAAHWDPLDPINAWQHAEVRQVVPSPLGFLQAHATFPVDLYISGYSLTLP
jgi:hypothetical protein